MLFLVFISGLNDRIELLRICNEAESNLKQTYLFFVMIEIIYSSLFLFLSSFKLLDIKSRSKNYEKTEDFFNCNIIRKI